MTKEEFKKLSDLASQWYAENMVNYLKEYDWDKFVMVADYSTMFGSKRNKYDLYKNDIKITPYINEKGEYKSNETESAKKIDEKYIQMGMSTIDLRTLTNEDTKYNIWEFTLYPSGLYESEFIWDNQAHSDYLVLDIDTFFSFLYDEVPLYLDRNYHNDTLWDSIEIRISFQEGKIQPLKIVLKTGEITTDYAVLIQNITYDESIYLIKRFEDIYELTNNGELKGVLSPTWNTAIMRYQAIDYFDFKKQVSFEWREENA